MWIRSSSDGTLTTGPSRSSSVAPASRSLEPRRARRRADAIQGACLRGEREGVVAVLQGLCIQAERENWRRAAEVGVQGPKGSGEAFQVVVVPGVADVDVTGDECAPRIAAA